VSGLAVSGPPASTDVIVVGGGTAGAAVAHRLVRAGRDVLVLEAGPDPGPQGDPRWPADLLDASRLGSSCDWGFDSADTYPDQRIPFERSRILGGCSTHNGAVQTWGHRSDYADWARVGGAGWETEALAPVFDQASRQLAVRTYAVDELTPFQQAFYDAAPGVGLPHLTDLNDLDETVGIAPESVNIVNGVRFNNAFAYLDPVRGDPHLSIAGDVLVDRLLLERGRAVGVRALYAGQVVDIRAELVILCGGTFGTPPVLLRSGIGPAAELAALGIEVFADAPGVGANLHDQPFVLMSWEGSAAIAREMEAHASGGWAPDEQVLAKVASTFDPGCFDLHILPYSPTHLRPDGSRSWHAGAGCLQPLSRGRVWLTSANPDMAPRIDHAFYTDPAGHDLDVLVQGVARIRELAAQPGLRDLLGAETSPGPVGLRTPEEIHGYLRAHIDSYWHPVGTCAMGPADDPLAVCDGRGEVHAVPGCLVADCALMPSVPRATTAMPATVIGERVATFVTGDA
jgi:choline dehydrogenase